MSSVCTTKVIHTFTYVHIPTHVRVIFYVYICKAISAHGKLGIFLLKQNMSVFWNWFILASYFSLFGNTLLEENQVFLLDLMPLLNQ